MTDSKYEFSADSLLRNTMDRLILPGALGFTRFGYRLKSRSWAPLDVSMNGRTAIVTGATSGLGRVTAQELAGLGARVVLVGRNAGKIDRAVHEIRQATANQEVVGELADLGLVAEVRELASRLLKRENEIHVLINNAAVLPTERSVTAEGLETAFATDLLSPYLLTQLLIPRLRDSAPARIINVTSGGMYLSGIEVDDLQYEEGRYDGSRAYARAKRGLMILTETWAGELANSNVTVNAMHPGWADTPGVRESLPTFYRITRPVLRTPQQGADTAVWLASAPEAANTSGRLWLDRKPHLAAILPGTEGSPVERKQLISELDRTISELKT